MKEQAVPFALGAVLGLLAAISAKFVERRAAEFATKVPGATESAAGIYALWAADAVQTFVTTATPLLTALPLVERPSSELSLGYALVMVVGFGLFGKVLYTRPDRYARRQQLGMGLVPWIGIALNVAVGAVVQIAY